MRTPFVNLERLLLVTFFVVAAGMWWLSRAYPLNARMFPGIVSATVVVLTVYVLLVQFQAWRRGTVAGPDSHADPGSAPILRWPWSVAATLGFLLAAAGFGFGTGLLVFISALSRRLGLSWPQALLYGVVLSVLVWYSFGALLNVPLPRGAILHVF